MCMKKMNKLWLLVPLFSLFGCYSADNEIPAFEVVPYKEDMIVLQNLKTRVLAYCYSSPSYKGFVRLTDVPRLPAEYDALKADTYPTRRWRKDNKIPRW